jgi:rSAM/selenodomain-associated transferase 1
MKKKAVILFTRNPVLGRVKTRLAATIGRANALEIYKKLLDHTRSITLDLPCDKYVFYEDEISYQDIWNNEVYQKRKQDGNGLGERMTNAFQSLFDNGYKEVLIIGSDCYELAQNHLEEAFEFLHAVDIVLGPASDGGYYLLGLKEPAPELFTDIAWSSSGVFSETINRLKELNRRYHLLQVRNDVDEEKDLPVGWRLNEGRLS